MNKKLTIIPPQSYKMILQSITESDIENLRIWKNKHRASFFYKNLISPDQQVLWYQNYITRQDDYMFVVKDLEQTSIGCLGFRLINDKIDLYNIIRGKKNTEKIFMQDAMHIMLNFITQRYHQSILCDVLKDNPAVNWYQKCGFAILEENDYYVMSINSSKIPKIEIIVKEE